MLPTDHHHIATRLFTRKGGFFYLASLLAALAAAALMALGAKPESPDRRTRRLINTACYTVYIAGRSTARSQTPLQQPRHCPGL